MKTDFDALLAEIGDADSLLKALGDDDARIAAAAEGGKDGAAADGDGDEEGDDDKGEGFAKAFEVTLPDGSKGEAVDAADLLKSFDERLVGLETGVAKVLAPIGTLLKSLTTEVAELRKQGVGRKAVVAVTPQGGATDLTKSHAGGEGLKPAEFMAKAMTAKAEGKIGHRDLLVAEAAVNSGQQPPAAIVRAILGG